MSNSYDTVINDILTRYVEEERTIEQKLQECNKKMHRIKSKANPTSEHYDFSPNNIGIEKETTLLRNQLLLKELEKSKARLRTLATFSPTNQELYDLITFYKSGLLMK